MGLHPRLGAHSPLARLPPDCLRRIAGFVRLLNTRWLCAITARTGLYVDCVAFHYSDGTSTTWGGRGGQERTTFRLLPGEYITSVRGRLGDYLDSVAFLTSRGRMSPRWGGPGGRPFVLELSAGEEAFALAVQMDRQTGYPQDLALVSRRAPSAEDAEDAARLGLPGFGASARSCYCRPQQLSPKALLPTAATAAAAHAGGSRRRAAAERAAVWTVGDDEADSRQSSSSRSSLSAADQSADHSDDDE